MTPWCASYRSQGARQAGASLAPIANAPANVIHMLAFDDDIDVAHAVLKQSERLEDPALVASANTKSQRHLFAISQRRSLSEAVTDILVERGDRAVVHSVVTNVGARFSDAGFRLLVNRSAADDDLATIVGAQRHPASAFSGAVGKSLEHGAHSPCRREP